MKEGLPQKPEQIELPSFPVEFDNGDYWADEQPELVRDTIVHYRVATLGKPEGVNKFKLLKDIEGYDYVFACLQAPYGGDIYELVTKTALYGYARTSLSKQGLSELAATRMGFLQSVVESGAVQIESIASDPYSGSHTAEEAEQMADAIIAADYLPFQVTRQDLLLQYQDTALIDLYASATGNSWPSRHNHDDKRAARSRLFRQMFAKYLPEGWSLQQDPSDNLTVIPPNGSEQ